MARFVRDHAANRDVKAPDPMCRRDLSGESAETTVAPRGRPRDSSPTTQGALTLWTTSFSERSGGRVRRRVGGLVGGGHGQDAAVGEAGAEYLEPDRQPTGDTTRVEGAG